MATVTVRQSGGAEIVSIPKAIGKALGLHVGSELDLSIVDNRIVLDPVVEKTSLEELLGAAACAYLFDIGQQRLPEFSHRLRGGGLSVFFNR